MGVLQRFERRLEGLVEGAFARVFGGVVQPVEIAAALQREAQDRKAIVGHDRVLVPNEYVVELGPSDAERLGEYDEPLRAELTSMVREHAHEQGWSFVGPVVVRFETVGELTTGTFRVRSAVRAQEQVRERTGALALPPQGRPQLVVSGDGGERTVVLAQEVTVVGRGQEADLRVADTGVSRRHAELRLAGEGVVLTDLGSTNGTRVNGRTVGSTPLSDGDRIEVGTTTLTFRAG